MSLEHQVDNMCKKLRTLPQNSSGSGSVEPCQNHVIRQIANILEIVRTVMFEAM